MSTTLSQSAPNPFGAKLGGEVRIGIVTAEWNSQITHALRDGAIKTLKANGVEDIDCFDVPGAIELTFGASQLIESGLFDAVIVFGCVIRGGTPHFDYVCQSVTQGITHLNAECDIPVIFGVLTVDCEQDAIDRAGGDLGNKGCEAADAALKMCQFVEQVKDL